MVTLSLVPPGGGFDSFFFKTPAGRLAFGKKIAGPGKRDERVVTKEKRPTGGWLKKGGKKIAPAGGW